MISDRPLSGATPVTFGVALPKGVVADEMQWRLRSSPDDMLPVQTRILDRWHDGSARWMLVDAQVTAAQPNLDFVLEPAATARTVRSLTIVGDSGNLLVSTGASQFTVGAN